MRSARESTYDQGALSPRRDRTRAAIIAAAVELFHPRDPAEVSITEIVEQSATSVGTLYTYFPSKTALYEAVVESCVSVAIGAVDAYAVANTRSEASERLLARGAAYAALSVRRPQEFRFAAIGLLSLDRPREHSERQMRLWRTLAHELALLKPASRPQQHSGSSGRILMAAWTAALSITGPTDEHQAASGVARITFAHAMAAVPGAWGDTMLDPS